MKEKEHSSNDSTSSAAQELENCEIARYSRQLILPEIGVQGEFIILVLFVYCIH